MFRSRLFLGVVLIAALSLLAPALGSAQGPGTQSCTIDYCPSAGLYFECCDWMPDCPCQTCPDFC